MELRADRVRRFRKSFLSLWGARTFSLGSRVQGLT